MEKGHFDCDIAVAKKPSEGPLIEKPLDKRSAMVNHKHSPHQVLCYLCCAEFGTNSLHIHQKTCIKKHGWGLNSIENEDGVSKKTAAANRKKCCEPGSGPDIPIPPVNAPLHKFEEYNEEAFRVFSEHSSHCLFCRTRNVEAMEAAKKLQADALRKAQEEEAKRKQQQDELDAERRRKEEREQQDIDDDNRRRADEARRRKLEEEDRLQAVRDKEARDKFLMLEAHRKAKEEVNKWMSLAEEEEKLRLRRVARGKHTFLHKGEGVQTAHVGAKIQHDREANKKAEQDIAKYSISHAKKEGLVHSSSEPKKKDKEVEFNMVEEKMVDGQWQATSLLSVDR